ncbi:MAG: hypothetical protein KDC26_11370 [Armatimonadetes bacterium]|nr:hypothetical protein [Armatimonadota bacterium]
MTSLTFAIRTLSLCALTVLGIPAMAPIQTSFFTDAEKKAISDYWNQDGRYIVAFPDDSDTKGIYQARQTPDGSTWLLNYYKKARGQSSKVIPGRKPEAQNDQQKEWDKWVETKYAYDEWAATKAAAGQNGFPVTMEHMEDPGATPADIVTFAGAAPKFVDVVTPRVHRINFEDLKAEFPDNIKVRRMYSYYRFSDGVMHVGDRMKGREKELMPLFEKGGLSDSEYKIMAAVSILEGGFDSINTYDTGYVSVGFIQFASLSGGAGSLGQTLKTMKTREPSAYHRNFRRFGIDVTEDGKLVALDIKTGEEKIGADAAMQIIKDRRLIAVFHRAGKLSEEYRIAQILTAKSQYFPAQDTLEVKLGDKTLKGKIGDIVKSEAGLATLMDRKVNTGKYGDLESVLASMALSYKVESWEQFAPLEYEIINAMEYRDNYLERKDLSQPAPSKATANRGK